MPKLFAINGAATKAEIAMVLFALSVIIGSSYVTADYAATNTPPDPVFRHLVKPESTKSLFKTEYLFVPLLFQAGAWLSVGASLLPVRIQESWLLTTHGLRRPALYFSVVFCLLAWAGIYGNSSNSLRATSAASSQESSSTSASGSAR